MGAAAKLQKDRVMPEKPEPYRGPHRDSGWTWLTADGSKIEVGSWYKSKRGFIVKIVDIAPNPTNRRDPRLYVHTVSHETGNTVYVDEDQVSWFTRTEDPGTPCGTMVVDTTKNNKQQQELNQYDTTYSKHPHVVPGSIYKVQNTSTQEKIPTWERKRTGQKLSIKGQIRCKIKCVQCGNERDIKVQDAFQVKLCLDCKDKKRKADLTKFLTKKQPEKKVKATGK